MTEKPTYEELEQWIKEIEEEYAEFNLKTIPIRIQRDLSIALNSVENLNDGLGLCLEAALKASGMDCGAVYLFNETSGTLDMIYHDGLPYDFVKESTHYDSDSDNAKLMLAGEPVYTQHQKLGISLSEVERQENLYAIAVLPISHHNHVIGCLNIASHSLEKVPFTSRNALEAIAAQIGGAILRLQAEAELRESEEKYRTMLENIEDGYYEVDLKGNFPFFNKSMCKIIGYTAEEMVGMNYQDYLGKKNAKKIFRAFNNVLRTGKSHKLFDWEIIRKDGSKRFVEASITLIKDSTGKPVGFRGVSRDVTDKKHLELQLQHAQKMEAIGTFAGGIAHDFNNILGSIVLNSEMALEDIPEKNDAKYSVEQVLYNSRRAKELVKHILTFSRLEEVERKPLKISFIVKESFKMLRAMIPSTIVIRQNIFSDVATIMADPTQIQQLVTNLCANSLHAIGENGGTLDVELKNVKIYKGSSYADLKAGSYVKLTIKDSGYGITPENKARIFDPFFTTKQPGEGTGLGLSVVHGIVKNNEGTIKVDSERDKGTAFHVFFPIINDTMTPIHESDRSLLTGTERILFVDDEEALVDSSRRMLERIGYTVVASNSGEEALELFQSNPDSFDIVITDTTMPNMTGVQLSEKLLKTCPDIPIIICTGHSNLIPEEKLDDTGIRECVMKPFEMREMAEAIRRILDDKLIDRREHERFKVKDGAIATPTSDLYKQGKIIDISKSGLAFCYKGKEDLSKEFAELAINISLKKFNLGNIPCRTIADLSLTDGSRLESELIRRCSIQFNDLTSIQTDQLEHFIENHTIAG